MNLKKLTHFFIYGFLVLLLSTLALFGLALWEEETLRRYSNSILVQYASTQLPETYQIQHLDIQWSFRELLRAEVLMVRGTLLTPFGNLWVQGPIGFERKSLFNLIFKRHKDFSILVKPEFSFGLSKEELTPFANGAFRVTVKDGTHQIKNITFQMNFDHMPQLPIQVENLIVTGDFKFENHGIKALANFSAANLNYKNSTSTIGFKEVNSTFNYENCKLIYSLQGKNLELKTNHLLLTARPELQGQTTSVCESTKTLTDLQFDLFSANLEIPKKELIVALGKIQTNAVLNQLIPTQVKAKIAGKQLEVLWKEEYIDPPIENYNIHFTAQNEPDADNPIHLKKVNIQVAQANTAIPKKKGVQNNIIQIDILGEDLLAPNLAKSILLDSKFAVADIKSFLPPVTLAGWGIKGRIQTKANLGYTPQGLNIRKGTSLLLDKFHLQHDELRHLSRDISVKWTAENNHKQSLNISMPSIRQLNMEASLGPWHLPITYKKNRFNIPETQIPLTFKNLNMNLSPLKASLIWTDQIEYSFESGLELNPVTLKDLSQQLCISPDLTPPGSLELSYPQLRLAHNHVYTKGEGLLKVFDGEIKINEFEIDKLLSESPVTFLSASWKNLELARIGEFTNFGGMEGHASGYMNGVSFVGTILKEYDFEFRLKPRPNASKFYFSRKATQNLVEIFAQGQGLSQGPANYLLKLSSQLFGDYGINYAGLRAHTQRNFVILETFDPPSVVKKNNSHFLLYGSRIKMPLSTQTYPVVLSKGGWNGFVYYFRDSLVNLMNTANSDNQDRDNTSSPKSQPQNKADTTSTSLASQIPCFDPSQEQRN